MLNAGCSRLNASFSACWGLNFEKVGHGLVSIHFNWVEIHFLWKHVMLLCSLHIIFFYLGEEQNQERDFHSFPDICSFETVFFNTVHTSFICFILFLPQRHKPHLYLEELLVDRIWRNFVQCPGFFVFCVFFSWNSMKILKSHDLVFANPSPHYTEYRHIF